MAEYLHLKQFNIISASQAVKNDFPDLHLTTGQEHRFHVCGASEGKDFITLRRGQLRNAHWAGIPFEDALHYVPGVGASEVIQSLVRDCSWKVPLHRADEQLQTAGGLASLHKVH